MQRDKLCPTTRARRQADPCVRWQAVTDHPSTYPFVLLSFMACALAIAIGMTASTAAL